LDPQSCSQYMFGSLCARRRRDTGSHKNKATMTAAELDVTSFHQRLAKLHKHFVKHK
jgi:hypothetical protein